MTESRKNELPGRIRSYELGVVHARYRLLVMQIVPD